MIGSEKHQKRAVNSYLLIYNYLFIYLFVQGKNLNSQIKLGKYEPHSNLYTLYHAIFPGVKLVGNFTSV